MAEQVAGSVPVGETIFETGREVATRVVDALEPRVEVLFGGEGTYRGLRFATSWNTEVVPTQDGAQRGTAQGMLSIDSGEFVTWQAQGRARFDGPGRFIAEGTLAFTHHGGQVLGHLSNRMARFRFQEDDEGNYSQSITLLD